MFSKKPQTFSGGSGTEQTLKELTDDLTRRRAEEEDAPAPDHPTEGKGVEAILKQRLATQSRESRDIAMRKAMTVIGASPEEREPLACILLGSLSGVHEFTVAMIDSGCTAKKACTRTIRKALFIVRNMNPPLKSRHARQREA